MTAYSLNTDMDEIAAVEKALAESFESDVADELELFDRTNSMFKLVLEQLGPARPVQVPVDREGLAIPGEDTPELVTAALAMAGAHIFSIMRAARAVLSIGLEFEAQPYMRILVEYGELREAIVDDDTGRQALLWMRGHRSAGKGRFDRETQDLYANLCGDSHANVVAAMRRFDAEDSAIELAPRRTHRTQATLLMFARHACQHAALLASRSDEVRFEGLAELAGLIEAAWLRLAATVTN